MYCDSFLLVVFMQLIPQVLMFSLFLTHLTGLKGIFEAEEQLLQDNQKVLCWTPIICVLESL